MSEKDIMVQQQMTMDEFIYAPEIKSSYWVNQSTFLINAIQDLSIPERRIIYPIIALVQPEDEDFKTYVINVIDLAQLLGYKGNSIYGQVQDAIDSLMKKQLTIHTNDGKQDIIEKIQWVQKARYELGTGRITIQLSDALGKFLLNLEKYAKYRLFNVLRLNSEYSWRIYELLKEAEWKKERIIRVDELRKKLAIPNDKMKLMKVFRETVLNQAQKELKEKTDIEFTYEVYKKAGRKIDSFIFHIKRNKRNLQHTIDVNSYKADIESLVHVLIREGINRKVAEKLTHTYTLEYIDSNIKYVLSLDSIKIKDRPSYIVAAIKENYAEFDGPDKKSQNYDPLENIILVQVLEKLRNQVEKDNQALIKILKKYEKILINNPDTDLQDLLRDRKREIMERFDTIHLERENLKLPPILLDDLDHPTIKAMFQEWQSSGEIIVQ